MTTFPRTEIDGLSVPRLIIGTNWLMGWSHTSKAQDNFIKELQTRDKIADVLEVFFKAGIDTILGGRPDVARFTEGVREAEQRTGIESIWIGTPTLNIDGTPEAHDANMHTLDAFKAAGCRICMPHQATTDALLDRRTRTIRDMAPILAAIREREMIPGLSTHMPEAPIYADETGLDVATYIQIYNAAGFLMQIEVDWVHRSIWKRQKPVIAIKPFAAGRLHPLVGLAFNWSTIRDQDMVCVGCMTPAEAHEVIEMSLALLEHRSVNVELQSTRSKGSVTEQ